MSCETGESCPGWFLALISVRACRDLWGPLFLCLILAILLSIDESGNIQESTNRDRPAVVFSVMLLVNTYMLLKTFSVNLSFACFRLFGLEQLL